MITDNKSIKSAEIHKKNKENYRLHYGQKSTMPERHILIARLPGVDENENHTEYLVYGPVAEW